MLRHSPQRLRPLLLDTRRCRACALSALSVLFVLSVSSAQAQSGSFLESLFRSIAEKQLQEAAQPNRRRPGGFPGSPFGPPTPPGFQTPPGVKPPPGSRPPSARPPVEPDDAHPHEVHEFDLALTQFHDQLGELMRLVQRAARSNREYREQLPPLYQLRAEVGALASRAESASRLASLVGAYQEIDRRYRELSFRLRDVPQRDQAMRQQIARCDATGRKLGQIAGIPPQFDRHGLHDQMVIAATYIQALIDDLPDSRMSRSQSRSFVHQARLLRQAILEEANHVETLSYDEIVTNYTDFVARWRPFAESLASFREPMIERRLSRIKQCGDETYALLWLAPPPSHLPPAGGPERYPEQWLSKAAALEGQAEYFSADLQRLQRYLRPDDYARSLIEHSRDLHDTARTLHRQIEAGEPLQRLQRTTDRLASIWKSMSRELDDVDRHGLTRSRARAVQRQQQQMLPGVASLTAALLQETP